MLTGNGRAVAVFAVVAIAVGWSFGYREFVVFGLIAGACLLVALLWMTNRPELQVVREITPARVAEGEPARGVLTVSNTGNRRSAPLVASELVGGVRVQVGVPSLPAHAEHIESYDLPTDRRGCYAVGPLTVSSSDPLRLIAADSVSGGEGHLWVHPRTDRVRTLPLGRSQEWDGPTNAGAPRGGVAFHSLREYEPGDDLRLIHWRSTAKTGTLMVRHNVVTNEPEMMVVLDTSAEPYGSDPAFEDAVRIVASLTAAGVEQRYPVEFWTTGGLTGRIDQLGLGRTSVFDRLAVVEPAEDDPGLAALAKVAPSRSQGTVLGVVTGRLSPERARSVDAVRRRFTTVTVVQVGVAATGPAVEIAGVTFITVADAAEFADRWKAVAR